MRAAPTGTGSTAGSGNGAPTRWSSATRRPSTVASSPVAPAPARSPATSRADERTSSLEAAQRFAAGRAAGARRRRDAAQLDALAAVVILERWLAEPGSRLPLADSAP